MGLVLERPLHTGMARPLEVAEPSSAASEMLFNLNPRLGLRVVLPSQCEGQIEKVPSIP